MEEMTRKQPDVDRVTKTYKRKNVEPTHAPFIEKSRSGSSMFPAHYTSCFFPANCRWDLTKCHHENCVLISQIILTLDHNLSFWNFAFLIVISYNLLVCLLICLFWLIRSYKVVKPVLLLSSGLSLLCLHCTNLIVRFWIHCCFLGWYVHRSLR